MSCKDCKNGLKRCDFSYRKYGAYHCGFECLLIENERTPFRKFNDTCEKFIKKREPHRFL